MGYSSPTSESIYKAMLAEVELSQVGRALQATEGSETDRQTEPAVHQTNKATSTNTWVTHLR